MKQGRTPLSHGAMKNLTIRFTAEELQWLSDISKKQYRPMAGMVRYIVAQYRKEQELKTECPNLSASPSTPDTRHS